MINYEDVQRILHTKHWLQFANPEWLRENIPELHALIGREQRADYHPEGDSFTHTLLVIDRALEITDDSIVHFCALTHDFGKAITIQVKPGSHYDHESLGVPLVREFCNRIGAPEFVTQNALAVCKEHLNVHRFLEMKGIKRARLLARVWPYIDVLSRTCQADAQGRGPTLVNEPYPQAKALRLSAAAMETHYGWQNEGPGILDQSHEQAAGRFLEGMFPRQKR